MQSTRRQAHTDSAHKNRTPRKGAMNGVSQDMYDDAKYSWQSSLLAVITEFDPALLLEKIGIAEVVIAKRLLELNAPDREEAQALDDARRTLTVLKRR